MKKKLTVTLCAPVLLLLLSSRIKVFPTFFAVQCEINSFEKHMIKNTTIFRFIVLVSV